MGGCKVDRAAGAGVKREMSGSNNAGWECAGPGWVRGQAASLSRAVIPRALPHSILMLTPTSESASHRTQRATTRIRLKGSGEGIRPQTVRFAGWRTMQAEGLDCTQVFRVHISCRGALECAGRLEPGK